MHIPWLCPLDGLFPRNDFWSGSSYCTTYQPLDGGIDLSERIIRSGRWVGIIRSICVDRSARVIRLGDILERNQALQ